MFGRLCLVMSRRTSDAIDDQALMYFPGVRITRFNVAPTSINDHIGADIDRVLI